MYRKNIKSLFVCVIIFALVFSFIPFGNFVVNAQETNEGKSGKSRKSSEKKPIEIIEKRTPTSKTFDNLDGTYSTEISQQPIHFKDENGKWEEIDNKLIEKENNKIQNTANDFTVEFVEKVLEDDAALSISDNEMGIKMGLVETNDKEQKEKSVNEVTGTVDGNSITYKQVADNFNVVYTVGADHVKEDIIYTEMPENGFPEKFTYQVSLDGLEAQTIGQAIYLVDPETKKKKYLIEAPYMYDSFLPEGYIQNELIPSIPEEAKSYNLNLETRIEDGQLYMDLIPDAEWLNDEKRQYPITIDPTIIRLQGDTKVTTDTTIRSAFPTTTGGNDNDLGIGTANDGNIVRSLLRFDLTAIPAATTIVSADLNLWFTSTNSSSPIDINLQKVTKAWEENEATWNKSKSSTGWAIPGGDYAVTKLSTVTGLTSPPSDINNALTNWHVPISVVQGWLTDSSTNYGFLLKSSNESTKIYKKFASSEQKVADKYKPQLVITYKTTARLGLEDYWDYSENKIDSGTQYTNLGTLNNIFQVEDFTLFNNADFNLTFKRTYNSKDYEKSALGNGWTFTGAEKIFVETGSKKTDIEYKDEDGTSHVFKYNTLSGTYEKPKGFDSTLKKVNGSIYTITSREGIVSSFTIREIYEDTDVKVAYITEKKDANNNKYIYSYDSFNKLTSVYSNADSNNQRIDLTYNDANQLKLIKHKNEVVEFEYDNRNNLISTDKKRDNTLYTTTNFIYDENNLIKEINENGILPTIFEYNNFDLKSQKLSSDSSPILYTLDRTNKVATNTNPMGIKMTLGLNKDYIVTSINQGDGKVTSYELDDNNRIIEEKTTYANQDSYFKEFEYDVAGNLIGTRDSEGVTTVKKYDANNNLIEEINEHEEKTSYKYDTKSNLIQKIDSNNNYVSYIYDNFGDLLEVSYSNGNVERYLYDKNSGYKTINYVNSKLNTKYTKVFDKNENLISSVDESGKKTTYKYNSKNELTFVIDDLGTTNYEYDSQGNITKIIDAAGNIKSYKYNQKGLKTSETDALGNTVYYEYNDNDTVKKVVNPNSNSIIAYSPNITYSDLFIQSKILENGAEKFTINESGMYTTYVNNFTGDKTEYKRLNNGLLESVTFNDGLKSKINYTYNIDLLSSIKFHDELYTFTSENDMVSSATLNGNPLFNISYNNDTGLKKETVYSNIGAGIQNSYFENNQQLKQQVLKSKLNSIYDTYNYEYNDVGQLTAITTDSGKVSYKYDEHNQLVEESYPNNQTITYSYDKLGNRISKIINNSITAYEYNKNNQIESFGYDYDANGNMTKNGAFTYHWNAFNQLVKVTNNTITIANYEYDKEGRRVYSKVNNVEKYYRYDGETDYLLYEENKDGSSRKSYTYDADGFPLTMAYNGKLYYYLTNFRGDVLALLDSQGNIVAEYTYDSWGNILSQKDLDNQESIDISMENPYRYAGYRYDKESNLYYLLGRYYNSDAGVFLSRDSYIGDLNTPKSMHGYIYADNNPIANVDPNGERARAIIFIFSTVTKKFMKKNKKASLIWSSYRVKHVREHGKNNRSKPYHGVFNEDPIVTTNVAWGRKGNQKPRLQKDGRLNYVIWYKNVGYQGGYKGSKKKLNNVKIVVGSNGRSVITSFPW